MTALGRRSIVVPAALALLVVSGGCASTGTATATWPADGVQTLNPGWERFFKLDWQSEERKGKPVVTGRIENLSVPLARNLQLLVESLDEQGKVVNRGIVPLNGDLMRSERRYFEVPVGKSANYRVGIFAYDWTRLDCG